MWVEDSVVTPFFLLPPAFFFFFLSGYPLSQYSDWYKVFGVCSPLQLLEPPLGASS